MAELAGIARLTLHDGMAEEFKRLAAECVEIMRFGESGTLQYEVYLDDDERECVFLERYRDSDALLEHNAHLGERLQAMLATGTVTAELFNPSDQLRSMFADAPVRCYSLFRSLQRNPRTSGAEKEER